MSADRIAERKRELERRLAELSDAKRDALGKSLEVPAVPAVRTIPPRDAAVPAPLSYAQELLWLFERTNPGHAYNVPRVVRLKGPIDRDALQRALDALVLRHESLRSTFSLDGAQSRQDVHPPAPVVMAVTDLRSVPASDRESAARSSARDFARQPFDLERDPQLRAALLRLDDDDHVLALVSHHIASDGWSGNIVLRELGLLYQGFRSGSSVELPALPVQYADYAVWQRRELAGPRLNTLLDYWRSQLAGATTQFDLPTDRPRSATASFEGELRSLTLPQSATAKLRQLIEESGATSFMVFLAALYVLIYRYSGEEELIVGTPVAGRTVAELDGIVGFFTNTLLLRGSLAGNPTFRQFIDRVRTATLGAFDHQDIPLEALLLDRRPDGSATATAPQVMLLTEDPDRASFALAGTEGTRFGIARGATKFDLTFHLGETASGLRITTEFRSDLFDAGTIDRLAGHFGTILESAIAAPDTPVLSLRMMPAAERRQVVEDFRGRVAGYPDGETLLDLIENAAAASPDAVAVEDDSTSLTHAELHARAATLAQWLVAQGVGRGSLVGLCLDRSVDMVVALLATLKAGAAYVPLDPEYPEDRLAFMLADAQMQVLLTQQHLAKVLPDVPVKRLFIDAQWSDVAATPVTATPARPRADDAAYMIYTSGSTGRPKGALNSHRGIVNRLRWMQDEYQLTGRDAVLQKTPFSFDVSVWEFFWPLMSGARLVMARPGGHRDPAYLASAVTASGVTVMHFVPSMLRAFLDDRAAPSVGTSLRHVVCSGEALPGDLAERFFTILPHVQLNNLYGPTEAAVDVSYWACRASDGDAAVPIGRPVANTQLYVLDARREPVPIGVPGELFIAGVQVGLGYHNRPELTNERFVPDPFSTAGARMYATGDRARWRADGVLEYLGRLDHQVKLRGHRIELAEIETMLAQQPGVAAALAMVREDLPGDQRLVAYIVATDGAVPSSSDLRAELRLQLPAIMVPAHIVTLERFPLTPNGKTDRRALPAPSDGARDVSEQFVAPSTPLEEEIAGIWAIKLGVKQVGITDDFFELGGNSLLAMRMIAEIERIWGRRLSFQAFFEQPTVATIVSVLLSSARADEEHGFVVLQEDGPGAPLVFAHGDVLGYGWYCRHLAPLIGGGPMIVLPTLGPQNGESHLTIEAMAAEHIAALRRVKPHGPYRLAGFCLGGTLAYEMARQMTASGEKVDQVIMVDAFCSNLRFRAFEPLIRLLSRAPTAERVIDRRARLLYAIHYRLHRLRQLRKRSMAEQLQWLGAFIRRKLGLAPARTPVAMAATGDTDGLAMGHDLQTVMADTKAMFDFVVRAQRGFMPGRYDGRVDGIWAADALASRPWLGDRGGWDKVARDLHPHRVSGTHIELVTPARLPELAAMIRECILSVRQS